MLKDDSYDRGRAMRLQIFGEPGVAGLDDADDFMDPLQDLVTRLCFGDVWSRPGLDLKTRSLLTVAILAGQARPDQLKNHVRGAVANGASKEELREVLMHATIYHGIPAGADNWRHVRDALKEIDAY